MDKEFSSHIIQYRYENNIVSVERHFINHTSIQELLKNYIEEQQNIISYNPSKKCCTNPDNTTVVDV